jgi:hypothetical protein
VAEPDSLLDILSALEAAGIDCIIVGGLAAVHHGAPVVTQDVDIVHRRTDANISRLLDLIRRLHGYQRFDPTRRRLMPSRSHLAGHVNLATDLGELDILCELEPGVGYEELKPESAPYSQAHSHVRVLSLSRVIEAKAKANRAKDRLALPILIATLDETRQLKGSRGR